jgi:hypothetical protein
MDNEAKMYYRFTSDSEPKEEQLLLLMQEVREKVRERNSNLQYVITENIQREYENIKKIFPNIQSVWNAQNS